MRKFIYNIEDVLENYTHTIDGIIEKEEIKENADFFEIKLKNEDTQIEEEDENYDNLQTDDWLEENIKLGDFGETLFINYLIGEGYDVKQVSKISNSYGYDILAVKDGSEKLFEIKVNSINISSNEIEKAIEFGIKYNLVLIKDGKYGIECVLINNPIKELHLDKLKLRIFENEFIMLAINNLYIEIKEQMMNKMKVINLDKYSNCRTIKEVLRKK